MVQCKYLVRWTITYIRKREHFSGSTFFVTSWLPEASFFFACGDRVRRSRGRHLFIRGPRARAAKTLFTYVNLVAVPKNSIPGKFTNIWDFTPIGIIATKFEKQRIFFNSDVFDAVVMRKRSLYIQVKEVTNLVQRISIHRSFESQILPQLTDTAHALPFLFPIGRQK